MIKLCRNDKDCFKANCDFKHSVEFCEKSDFCTNFNCQNRHTSNRKRKCKRYPQCTFGDKCDFLHPNNISISSQKIQIKFQFIFGEDILKLQEEIDININFLQQVKRVFEKNKNQFKKQDSPHYEDWKIFSLDKSTFLSKDDLKENSITEFGFITINKGFTITLVAFAG
eukprot:TRINITY_DN4656_c0_g1_i1.p1 TRINITY_DN4656_c0_g1~~TRINITY_DN4656_c0_g1_i1.p1  ORF type:complete len:169 (+),score=32.92 TRINITY_DN4656_c0_g1_i1:58-564(+)